MNTYWPIVAVAYLLGSIPFGFLIVKAFGGSDIRATGSGNIGAANVARNAGKLAGVLTLLLDAGKGYLAVWIAARWTVSDHAAIAFARPPSSQTDSILPRIAFFHVVHSIPIGGNVRWMMAAAVAAVVGHVFPVWLRFKGGKGVATGLGVFLVICPEAVAAAAALWLLVVVFWRYSSLGSIAAAAALPALVYLFYAPRHAPPTYVSLSTILISFLILVKHRANIERLIAGKESPLKFDR